MKNIYLDNAAATPVDSRVISAMNAAARLAGNPSAFNDAGRAARQALEAARTLIARFLNARSMEVVFTASGSEANNLALRGALSRMKKPVVLTTPIEHPSVLEALAHTHARLAHVPVDRLGQVHITDIQKLLEKEKPDLVSIMYANNEIGTIQPIAKIGKAIREYAKRTGRRVLFHTDACQAAGVMDMDVQRLGVDLLTFNGSKIYGPRGIGVTFIRRGTPMTGIVFGGSQEYGLRAGTENLPAIAGLAKAAEIIKPSGNKKIAKLRNRMIGLIKRDLPEAVISGPEGDARLPNNIHVSLPDLESEIVLVELDKYGIYAGSGSACTSHAVEPSHVLKAIGVPPRYINGGLRFSLGRQTTAADVDYTVKTLAKVIKELRKRYGIAYPSDASIRLRS
ncbi:MAG TPA: cysteine desulfurase family protein [Candidatus Paceibacterota bacterium]|nr:cysteine desulfurase family protein [Candidatus Paceibacterota bacterium]